MTAPTTHQGQPGADDYFANHARARRFPWSLYHRPIERDLDAFLGGVVRERPGANLLVIGCGLMHELDLAPAGIRFTVVDIDARAVDAVVARRDPRCQGGVVVPPEAPLDRASLGTFDAVYAKEVIEHIVDWPAYLRGLRQVIAPGGQVWLSTPNYGEPWLPALERTVLEWIARRSGFSRRDLHPSKFSRRTLARALTDAGFVDVRVEPVRNRLALVASARNPAT